VLLPAKTKLHRDDGFDFSTKQRSTMLNLLDVLTVNKVYRLQALKFTHLWHKGLLPSFFKISFNTPVKYTDTIPDMYLGKIYAYQKCAPILVNKQKLTQPLFSGTIFPLTLKISMSSTSNRAYMFIQIHV